MKKLWPFLADLRIRPFRKFCKVVGNNFSSSFRRGRAFVWDTFKVRHIRIARNSKTFFDAKIILRRGRASVWDIPNVRHIRIDTSASLRRGRAFVWDIPKVRHIWIGTSTSLRRGRAETPQGGRRKAFAPIRCPIIASFHPVGSSSISSSSSNSRPMLPQ